MKFPSKEQVEAIRKRYPAGTKIVVDSMDDPQAPKPGTIGTVVAVDDMGDLLMSWNGGGSLNLIIGEDSFHIASANEIAKEKLKALAEHQPKNRCPRCGAVITADNRLLALSRRLDITICEHCGTFEALEDVRMVDEIPLSEWIAVTEGWQ